MVMISKTKTNTAIKLLDLSASKLVISNDPKEPFKPQDSLLATLPKMLN